MPSVQLIAGMAAKWDERTPADDRIALLWNDGDSMDPSTAIPYGTPADLGNRIRSSWVLPWLETLFSDQTFRIPYGTLTPLEPVRVSGPFTGLMVYHDRRTAFPWGLYPAMAPTRVSFSFNELERADFNRLIKYGDRKKIVDESTVVPWSTPETAVVEYGIPWGKGIKPYAPRGTEIVDTNLPPPPAGTALHTVPYLLVYYQMNTATVSRLPELTPLDFKSLRISANVDSFGARWSGTLAAESYDLVKPNGAIRHEIEVTINGVVWHLLVEKPGRSLRFGRGDYQVSGRGLVAQLAAPHAQKRGLVSTADRNINQLADDELINTGWTLNWSAEFWLVPAGAWNYEDLAPIQAIARLAKAAGAVVTPAESLKELTVQPRYPISPWDWAAAAPNWSIPMTATYRLGSEWSEKPLYNAVIVSGESQGVLCNVTRQGSAGDIQAPMVVDPLVTHQDGGRERGRNIIADHGVQSIETLELPFRVAPFEPGLIRPLELVEYTDAAGSWRGLCVASDVAVEWGRGGLSIKQTVKVERHFDD